jgi:hypothetical protein
VALYFQNSVHLSCYSYSLYDIKKCDAGGENYGIGMKLKVIRQFESEIGNMDRHKHSMIVS